VEKVELTKEASEELSKIIEARPQCPGFSRGTRVSNLILLHRTLVDENKETKLKMLSLYERLDKAKL
jgi:hypothetical protein